ncbi:MAG TPA: cytochrome c biogenesis protein CcdA [Candidatus Bathyarchaeia archaeon]|nr:cytochrome c biogenesis protein CcdA [Candidatus Bathyarchaeia archaeon]
MSEDKTRTKKNRKWLQISVLTISIMVIIAGLGYGLYFYFSNRNADPAQDFSVMTLSGANFTLSDYREEVVLLDFMSVTCVPCMLLMDELVQIYNEFNDSLVMLSVDVDPSDTEAQLLDFKNDYNAKWDFALDTDGLLEKYGVLEIPKIVLIDRSGYITFAETGLTIGSNNLQELINQTIEGSAERIATISLGVSIGTAFISGFLSFFSPCAFPLLPGYMAYNLDLMTKMDQKEEEKVENDKKEKNNKNTFNERFWRSYLWGSAAGFGIFIFYMTIGIVISILVLVYDKSLENVDKIAEISEYLKLSVGILLIILGIISLTPISLNMNKAIKAIEQIPEKRKERKFKRLIAKGKIDPTKQIPTESKAAESIPQLLQLFIYGVTYALASIGCSLPILLGLMLTALQAGTFGKAIIIFVVYSLVMAILMIIITILVGFSKEVLINKLQASAKFVKIFTGILLILAGGFLMGQFLWNRFK